LHTFYNTECREPHNSRDIRCITVVGYIDQNPPLLDHKQDCAISSEKSEVKTVLSIIQKNRVEYRKWKQGRNRKGIKSGFQRYCEFNCYS